nr:hypothetical protein [Bradyrhizobium sp. CCBAU 53380]
MFASSAGSSFFMPTPIGCSTIGSSIIFSGCPASLDWLTESETDTAMTRSSGDRMNSIMPAVMV